MNARTLADKQRTAKGAGSVGLLAIGLLLSSIAMLVAGDSLVVKIYAMIFLWLCAAMSVRSDIAHPYLWFAGPYLIYAIAAPTLAAMGTLPKFIWMGAPLDELDYSVVLDLCFVGLVVFLVVVGPRRVRSPKVSPEQIRRLFPGVTPVFILFGILVAIAVLQPLISGIDDKRTLVLEGTFITRLSYHGTLLMCVSYFLYYLYQKGKITQVFLITIVMIVLSLFIISIVGQRSALYRVIIITGLLYHIAYKPVSVKMLAVAVVTGLLLNSVLGVVKMSFYAADGLSEEAFALADLSALNPELMREPPLMRGLKIGLTIALRSEPMTVGTNLAKLVERVPGEFDYLYGKSLYMDTFRAMLPGALLDFDDAGTESTQILFNKTFFEHNYYRGSGIGFTLVGEGYYNGGVFGVVVLFVLWGFAMRKIYDWGGRSLFGLLFMVNFAPIAIMSNRTDLSAPIGQGIKHLLLPMLLIIFISHLVGKSKRQRAARQLSLPRRGSGRKALDAADHEPCLSAGDGGLEVIVGSVRSFGGKSGDATRRKYRIPPAP